MSHNLLTSLSSCRLEWSKLSVQIIRKGCHCEVEMATRVFKLVTSSLLFFQTGDFKSTFWLTNNKISIMLIRGAKWWTAKKKLISYQKKGICLLIAVNIFLVFTEILLPRNWLWGVYILSSVLGMHAKNSNSVAAGLYIKFNEIL